MHKNRLFCGQCGVRKSKLEYFRTMISPREIIFTPSATCLHCGANIPLFKDEDGKYHPIRLYPCEMKKPCDDCHYCEGE